MGLPIGVDPHQRVIEVKVISKVIRKLSHMVLARYIDGQISGNGNGVSGHCLMNL